jgi:hypothetical protein
MASVTTTTQRVLRRWGEEVVELDLELELELDSQEEQEGHAPLNAGSIPSSLSPDVTLVQELHTLEVKQFLLALLHLGVRNEGPGRRLGPSPWTSRSQSPPPQSPPPSRASLRWDVLTWAVVMLGHTTFQDRELFLPAICAKFVGFLEELAPTAGSDGLGKGGATIPPTLLARRIEQLLWSWVDSATQHHHHHSVLSVLEVLAGSVGPAHASFSQPLLAVLSTILTEGYIFPAPSTSPALSNYSPQPSVATPASTSLAIIGESSSRLPFYVDLLRHTHGILERCLTPASPDVPTLFALLWQLDWKEWIQSLLNDSDDASADSIDVLLPHLIRASMACVRVDATLSAPFSHILVELLEDCSTIFTDTLRLDIYLLVIDMCYELFLLRNEARTPARSMAAGAASGAKAADDEECPEDPLDTLSQLFIPPCAPMLYIADASLQSYFRQHACSTFARCVKVWSGGLRWWFAGVSFFTRHMWYGISLVIFSCINSSPRHSPTAP